MRHSPTPAHTIRRISTDTFRVRNTTHTEGFTMGLENNVGLRNVRQVKNDCACNLPKVDMHVGIQAGKTELGRGEWSVFMRNHEPFPIFVTMATGEGKDCKPEDFDTAVRDLKICPGETAELKLPRCGNGVEYDAPYRIVARNQKAAVVGEVTGEFPADPKHPRC